MNVWQAWMITTGHFLRYTNSSFNTNLKNNFNKAHLSNNINNDLGAIQICLEITKISLNTKKTKLMIFHNIQQWIGQYIHVIILKGQQIEQVKEFNFLGLTIEENMTLNGHIKKIANKISRSLGIMNKLK